MQLSFANITAEIIPVPTNEDIATQRAEAECEMYLSQRGEELQHLYLTTSMTKASYEAMLDAAAYVADLMFDQALARHLDALK